MTEGIHWLTMSGSLLGGLALFLYGMDKMATALQSVAGDGLRALLARMTTNRFTGALTGALVTTIIQSSSVTTVMVVGFVTAGLMTFSQSIGIIMGANIGTTITAQVIAFRVEDYALWMIAIGFALLFFARQERARYLGGMLMGLGMIFFGMALMSEAMKPLRELPHFVELMAELRSPMLAILIGAVFTALVQSSSATTGIVIVLAAQGLVPIEAGIALIFGANIGTCITALLSAIGKPRPAVRAALAHVAFNVIGVVIWFAFIPYLADWVIAISPENPARDLANAHTIFNVSNTLLLIGFTKPLARLIEWLIPERTGVEDIVLRPLYLDRSLLGTPSMALNNARLEIARLANTVRDQFSAAIPAIYTVPREQLLGIAGQEERIRTLHEAVVVYLGDISRQDLLAEQRAELMELIHGVQHLETISDLVSHNLVDMGLQRAQHRWHVSAATLQHLSNLHQAVLSSLDLAITALTQRDAESAQLVTQRKAEINRIAEEIQQHELQRLIADEPDRASLFALEMRSIEHLKRIYYNAKRIARAVTSAHGEPERSA